MMIGDRAFYTLYDVASRRENSESDRGKLFARVRLLIARVRRVDGALTARADSSKWMGDERGRIVSLLIQSRMVWRQKGGSGGVIDDS